MSLITLITDRGRQILAARVPGDPPLASIRIAVGDGNGMMPVPNNAQRALVNERWRGIGAASLNGTRLGFSVTIPASIGGWTIREIGVFIGPDGAEELALVSQFGPQYKPTAGENGAMSLTPVLSIDYSGSVVGAFTITLDPNLLPLDPSVHRTVNARLAMPPANPVEGTVYAIAAGVTGGEWQGRGGQIARRRGTAWLYETPLDGHLIREAGANGAFWQKSGADYVPVAFPQAPHNHDDRYFTEAEVTGLLNGKSDTGHHHDERYYTETEADGRFVKRTGDTMSGSLAFNNVCAVQFRNAAGGAVPGAQGAMITKGSNNLCAIDNYEGDTHFRRAAYIPTLVLKQDGRVGVGCDPLDRFDVNGDVILRGNVTGHDPALGRTFTSDPPASLVQGGFLQLYGSRNTEMPAAIALGNRGQHRLVILGDGSFVIQGDKGSPNRVLTGNPAGPPAWRSLAELGIGRKLIALGVAEYGQIITFPPEPDAAYEAKVFVNLAGYRSEGQLESYLSRLINAVAKTTTSFQIPAMQSLGPDNIPFFFIAWR